MNQLIRLPAVAALAAGMLATGCSSNPRSHLPTATPVQSDAPSAPVRVASPPQPGATDTTAENRQPTGEPHMPSAHEGQVAEHVSDLRDRTTAQDGLSQQEVFAERRDESAPIDRILEVATADLPVPTPELMKAVEANLEATAPDVFIPLNSKVLSHVQLFQGRLRDWMAEGLQRGGRYLPMIQGVLRAEGLPLDLAYVALIESAFKPNALSRARARGVWQFMRGTAIEHGLQQDWYIDERADPDKATRAAVQYLKSLHGLFDGDWLLALAAYNAGPGRVQRAIRRSGRRDFWSLAARRLLPRETRQYVPMILAGIIIAKNPAEYGFDIITETPVAYESVKLRHPVDLRRAAEWIGTSVEEIQTLNPELRRWTTPVKHEEYALKVPVGSADRLQARLETASPAELTPFDRYTVRRGESLTSIARKLRVTRSDLAGANHLSVRARVRTGQELLIPRPPALALSARLEAPAGGFPAAGPGGSPPAAEQPASAEPPRVVYRVKRGDTLVSIARAFQTTVEALKAWNGLRGSRINAGHRLVIYATSATVATQQ